MANHIHSPVGQDPSKTEDPRVRIPFDVENFAGPAANSWGVGNTPLTLPYGLGVFNLDFSLTNFGTITGAQVQARRTILSARFKF